MSLSKLEIAEVRLQFENYRTDQEKTFVKNSSHKILTEPGDPFMGRPDTFEEHQTQVYKLKLPDIEGFEVYGFWTVCSSCGKIITQIMRLYETKERHYDHFIVRGGEYCD